MVTRRDFVAGSLAAAALSRVPVASAKPSQPSTAVNFDVPADAARHAGARRDARGVAVIDEKTTEAELDAMGKQGMCGIRLNLATGGTNDPSVAAKRFQYAAERMKARKWHVQLNTNLAIIATTRCSRPSSGR